RGMTLIAPRQAVFGVAPGTLTGLQPDARTLHSPRTDGVCGGLRSEREGERARGGSTRQDTCDGRFHRRSPSADVDVWHPRMLSSPIGPLTATVSVAVISPRRPARRDHTGRVQSGGSIRNPILTVTWVWAMAPSTM